VLRGSASPGLLQALPASLQPQVEAVVESIFRLHDHDLVLGAFESEWRRLEHDRPHLFEMLLSDTRRIKSVLPIISEGVARLNAGGTVAVQDPATRLRIQQVEAEIQVLLEKMEGGGGDEVVTQWRHKRGELKAIQTQASAGLDAAACRALFRAPKEWVAATPGSVVFQELGVRVSEITSCLENVDREVDELRQSMAAVSTALRIPEPPDESAWRQAEAAMVGQEVAGSRLIERKCDIQRRAGELLHAAPHSMGPSTVGAEHVLQLREAADMAATSLKGMQASAEPNRAARHAWMPLLQEWINDLRSPSSVENDWQHLEAEWPSQCNVVAITCNEREDTLDKAGHAGFDVAIIDEVSKATPLELLLPLMRARKAVLVGDHRQLPPLFQEGLEATSYLDAAEEVEEGEAGNSALTQENLTRFERMVTASLFKEHFEAARPGIRERLSVQFRMHPQIMNLVNHFYEGGLTCGLEEPDVERAHGFTLVGVHDHPIVTPKDHVAWIDTSRNLEGEVHCEDRDAAGRFMRTNRLEAYVIAQLLKQLDVQAVSQGHSRHKPLSVGVVSFYAGQLRLIRDAVKYAAPNGWQALDVEINTVIRYQGKEKDVVLVSLVRNDGRDGKSAAGRSSRANFARYEFINVAFSRARKLLLVLGARSMLQSYQVELPKMDRPGTTRRPVYQEMFRELEADGRIVDARHVMPAPQASNRRPIQPRSPRQGWRQ
ncbi:MAG: superfamily I DNA/RNA helicase, partial [Alcaligenaceae bacterium]